MKVLIVAKTRRGGGACVGGIVEDGRSVRLLAVDAEMNERAGMEYEIGEEWEIESTPDSNIIPPHVENIIVLSGRRVKRAANLEAAIHRHMPPVSGGPEKLFDGLVQATPPGALYIAEGTGLPERSTMFWTPDQPLQLDCEGKRIRYRCPTSDGGRTLAFVGFQEPLGMIPAGTLLRVSLANWWRPKDKPHNELRCFVQLSGWVLDGARTALSARVATSIPERADKAVRAPIEEGDAREVLKQTFGFSDFLPVQTDVIAHVLQRRDTLVVMPTGGGKSLCYQLPALLFDGLTVVVSPLIALMQDQVHQLRELEVPCAFLNSTLSHHEYVGITNRVRHGRVKILYVAPETLLRPETLLLMEQSRLCCLAVDEAHCISEWGHDFRPEYRQLQQVRRRFPQAVCVALTATATERVREDIRRLLNIAADAEFIASFNRQNLFLAVEPRRDGLAQTLAFLEKHRGESGIIYCGTRKQADELTAALNANGWPASPYHAGLDDDVRRQNQERFIRDDVPLMVATVAFGMGINKSNVRFVIHVHLPKDVESYYQEIGRAGRAGLRADCLLLYSRGDAMTIRHFIDEGAESEQPGRSARLNALMRFAEARDCRRIPLLAYFGETLAQPCGHCDNCVHAPETGQTTDATIAAQKFLSCVKRTGEMFGPAHIIAVLRGSRAERVLSRGHNRLSTYGVGTEHSTEEWRELAQQFIHLGLMDQDLEFGGLSITPKGWQVLKGEKVCVPLQHRPAAAVPDAAKADHDPELFEHLRALRRELAYAAGMPPYIIFSDRALVEMATFLPQDEPQFLAINGVGQAKLTNYGAAFLKAIRDYCEPRGLIPKFTARPAASTPIVRPVIKRRFHEVGELFAAGQSIDAIAERYAVQRETIIQHLQRCHKSGAPLDPKRLLASSRVSETDRTRVFAAFEQLGVQRLAPIHEALSGKIDYDELHLLRLYLLCHRSTQA
ncbi:MAG: DNA helicase RecQ [Verrucomicrobiales bacterium]|nr:DNA helicase RecQ [Verrucomicrobiales bacterium]